MGTLTKRDKAHMLSRIEQILDGKPLYTEEEVNDLRRWIAKLEAEIIHLKEQLPQMPDHKNIRGAEYYK
jgi:polyhydroxyalkanoate synthesis regulator phasin